MYIFFCSERVSGLYDVAIEHIYIPTKRLALTQPERGKVMEQHWSLRLSDSAWTTCREYYYLWNY